MHLLAFTSKSASKTVVGFLLTAAFLVFVGIGSVSAQTYVSSTEAQSLISQEAKNVSNDLMGITPGSLEFVQGRRKLQLLRLVKTYISQSVALPTAIEYGLQSVYMVTPAGLAANMHPTKTEWQAARTEIVDLLSN